LVLEKWFFDKKYQWSEEPVHVFDTISEVELGLLGLALSKDDVGNHVFIYVSESEEGKFLGNGLYNDFINGKLSNQKLLLDFQKYSNRHFGGALTIGPDNNVVGDYDNHSITVENLSHHNQSYVNSGGVIAITQDGKPVGTLGNSYPLNMFFAYGIRNSFGLGFDPVKGNLWATENGLFCCDEINV
jgi:aldose sugar dehydrogenase